MGWKVRGSNPGGARFAARPPGPGAHPASCKMGNGSLRGVKCGRGVLLTTHPLLVPRSWKGSAIPLPILWATTGRVTWTLYLLNTILIAPFEYQTYQMTFKTTHVFPMGQNEMDPVVKLQNIQCKINGSRS